MAKINAILMGTFILALLSLLVHPVRMQMERPNEGMERKEATNKEKDRDEKGIRTINEGIDKEKKGIEAMNGGIDKEKKGIGAINEGMDKKEKGIGAINKGTDKGEKGEEIKEEIGVGFKSVLKTLEVLDEMFVEKKSPEDEMARNESLRKFNEALKGTGKEEEAANEKSGRRGGETEAHMKEVETEKDAEATNNEIGGEKKKGTEAMRGCQTDAGKAEGGQ